MYHGWSSQITRAAQPIDDPSIIGQGVFFFARFSISVSPLVSSVLRPQAWLSSQDLLYLFSILNETQDWHHLIYYENYFYTPSRNDHRLREFHRDQGEINCPCNPFISPFL
jgi:hypothetical protein